MWFSVLLVYLLSLTLATEAFEKLVVWKPSPNQVQVTFVVDHQPYDYHLYLATRLYTNRHSAQSTYESKSDSFFQGAITFLDDIDDEYSGMFILNNNSVLTLNGRRNKAIHRELSEEQTADPITFDFTHDYTRQLEAMSCQFPNHFTVFEIGIVYDPTAYEGFGSNSTLIERYIEHMVVTGNVILKKFAKVAFRIADTQYGESMTCSSSGTALANINAALSEATSFANNDRRYVAHWHRISACSTWGSYAGLAWVNTMCSQSTYGYITGTSKVTNYQYTFRTFIHEMGHAFGCVHPFSSSSDQGQYGGIMDYGDGKLLDTGEYGYTNASLEYFCNKINNLEEDDSCPYSSIYGGDADDTCGDIFVTGTEECECPDGSLTCGTTPYTCVNCKLSDPSMECSNEFLVSLKNGPEGGTLSDKTCCTQEGVLQDVETSCENGYGYCAMGTCTNRCQDYFANLELCGTNGCRQQCIDSSGYCTSSLWIRYNGEVTYVTDVSDGSKCYTDESTLGHCESGTCIENTDGGSDTPRPTISTPSSGPTTTNPTQSPFISSTSNPTIGSTSSPTFVTKNPTPSTPRPSFSPTFYTLTQRPTLQPTSSTSSFEWMKSPTIIGITGSVIFILIIIMIVLCYKCFTKAKTTPPQHVYAPIHF